MIFTSTAIQGAYLIDLEKKGDSRGFFARAWCRREFEAHGLNPTVVQSNLSYTAEPGTVRGLHYQHPPHSEAKLVRCIRGAIFDAAVDLRSDSPTFKKWAGAELSAANYRMLFIPEGCAHGYLTLQPDTEVFYQVSAFYAPEAEAGVRWNDPAFGIEWPIEPRIVLPRDSSYPDFIG
jgi:dTDP-4-dehydrorhamnose 3,5-epimerase